MDRYLCAVCKRPLFEEGTSAGGNGDGVDRPEHLADASCCSAPCGHLIHPDCLIKVLNENANAGCPVCHEACDIDDCNAVRLPTPVEPPSPPPASASAPAPNSLRRSRTASTALGGNNAAAAKIPRGPGGTPPPAPPTIRCQDLVLLLQLQGVNLTTVFTPAICLRVDQQAERYRQAAQATDLRQHVRTLETNLNRLRDRISTATPAEQEQIRDRFTLALVTLLLNSDPEEVTDLLDDIVTYVNEWLEDQDF